MKRFLLPSLLSIALTCSALAQSPIYHVGTSADGIFDYHILSATADDRMGVMEVFSRVSPVTGKLAQFRETEIKNRQKLNLETEGFEKLAYYRRKIQYSCKGKKFRIVEVTYFDSRGKEIDQEERNDKVRWEAIPAGSIRELEFKKVCEQ